MRKYKIYIYYKLSATNGGNYHSISTLFRTQFPIKFKLRSFNGGGVELGEQKFFLNYFIHSLSIDMWFNNKTL